MSSAAQSAITATATGRAWVLAQETDGDAAAIKLLARPALYQ